MDDSSRQLFHQWLVGDGRAAEAIVDRYAALLFTIVVGRLSREQARRLDPEDVLQSIWKDFFTAPRAHTQPDEGGYQIEKPGDLRALLCTCARNKVLKKVAALRRQKRDYSRDTVSEPNTPWAERPQRLSEQDVVDLADEVEAVLRLTTNPDEVTVLQLMLEERTTEEIGVELKCSDRTVRRVLERVRKRVQWDAEKGEEAADSPSSSGADP